MSDIGTFIVIFPCGDRSRISVADITGTEYERRDYDCASIKDFGFIDEAIAYAKQLSARHALVYDGPQAELDRSA